MTYRIIFTPRAEAQLRDLRRHIAVSAGRRVAGSYIRAIVATCKGLSMFPHRGTMRDDIRPGMRTLGFRRRATITFMVRDQSVYIAGVFYGGQDFEAAFRDEDG